MCPTPEQQYQNQAVSMPVILRSSFVDHFVLRLYLQRPRHNAKGRLMSERGWQRLDHLQTQQQQDTVEREFDLQNSRA